MKISEFIVNNMIEEPLVVKSAVAKETRTHKPYLTIEFFDGQDTITGQYWDWTSGNIPATNTVLSVRAQVTEWQGTKQLNVKAMSTCTTHTLADFMPKSDFDIDFYFSAAKGMLTTVCDETLRTIADAALSEMEHYWRTVPGAKSVHHNFVGGTLVHSVNVANLAAVMADQLDGANRDLALVGGLLHDIGKLFCYKVDGVNIDTTPNGKLYDHIFIGAEFIGNFAESHVDTDDKYTYHKVRLLRHIILAHHGQREYGSPVTPQCIEAYIVHCADLLDANNEQLRVATKKAGDDNHWTEKIWTMGNQSHLTHKYVASIMGE